MGPFTEEQLAGSGGSGSLGDEQFLGPSPAPAATPSSASPTSPRTAACGIPTQPTSGAFAGDPKSKPAATREDVQTQKDKNGARERQRRRRRRAPDRIAGQPRQRGSGGGGGRAGARKLPSRRGRSRRVSRRSHRGLARGGGGDGDFSLNMDDYAQLDRMGNMDDLLGPILDDGALGGPGGSAWGTRRPGGFHHNATGGASTNKVKHEPRGAPGGIGEAVRQIAQSLSGERGGGAVSGAAGTSPGAAGRGSLEVKSEPNQRIRGSPDQAAAAPRHAPPDGAAGGRGMLPAADDGRTGRRTGPMPPGMQAMPPGTLGTCLSARREGGHGPPPGQPVQGPNGVMYFPGRPLPVLHLVNGGPTNPAEVRLEQVDVGRRNEEPALQQDDPVSILLKKCADPCGGSKTASSSGSTPDLGALTCSETTKGRRRPGRRRISVEEDS